MKVTREYTKTDQEGLKLVREWSTGVIEEVLLEPVEWNFSDDIAPRLSPKDYVPTDEFLSALSRIQEEREEALDQALGALIDRYGEKAALRSIMKLLLHMVCG